MQQSEHQKKIGNFNAKRISENWIACSEGTVEIVSIYFMITEWKKKKERKEANSEHSNAIDSILSL